MDDASRRSCERSGCTDDLRDLRAETELELALEDVERVRVLAVDVRIRTFLAGLVAEPGDRQLLAVGEEPERPLRFIDDRLALAGS